ncbi:MAG TPA: hypothetical protein VE135_21645 [Pyrinomonadaceae bacterium]|nr:hypothetical protein [Pyrinomonadaceae bacterium]
MKGGQNVDAPQPGDEAQRPPARPHDRIEPNPTNPKTVPSLPGPEPQPGELPNRDWDWAEHED